MPDLRESAKRFPSVARKQVESPQSDSPGLAPEKFHDQIRSAVVTGAKIEDLHKMSMRKTAQDPGLPLKPLDIAAGKTSGKKLDSDHALENQVRRPVDLAHTP